MSDVASTTRALPYRPRPSDVPRATGEGDAAYYERRERTYFDWHYEIDSDDFWHRISAPDFTGKRVMDIGCGDGALAANIAERGAEFVLGVDIDAPRMEFARRNLAERFPQLKDRVELRTSRVEDVKEPFDIVVSKDAMEHIDNPQVMVDAMYQVLRPGGLALFGFGPLYYSPFGDHGRYTHKRLPWLPVFLPHSILFRIATKLEGHPIRSLADVELNGITPAQFRSLFADDRWKIVSINYNMGGKRLLPILSVLRHIPFMEKFFTVSIYATILRR